MARTEETDLSRSLESLEGRSWGEPEYDSYVVRTVHSLRRKPLVELSNEELRLALSQRVGMPFILDLAFSRLMSDPLVGGDFYRGDILALLVCAEPSLWEDRPVLHTQIPLLVEEAVRQSYAEDFFGEAFREALGLPEGNRDLH